MKKKFLFLWGPRDGEWISVECKNDTPQPQVRSMVRYSATARGQYEEHIYEATRWVDGEEELWVFVHKELSKGKSVMKHLMDGYGSHRPISR